MIIERVRARFNTKNTNLEHAYYEIKSEIAQLIP